MVGNVNKVLHWLDKGKIMDKCVRITISNGIKFFFGELRAKP